MKSLVPRLRLEVRGGEISKGITKKGHLYKFIKENLENMKGAKGCITCQFFVSKTEDTHIFGIEINPRFGGGYPLSYHAGASYPKFIISEFLSDEAISFFDSWKENTLMLRYDNEIIVHQ